MDITCDIQVLTDDELAGVVGGGEAVSAASAQRKVYEKLGMCGCGQAHNS